jgi:hypothetical protein
VLVDEEGELPQERVERVEVGDAPLSADADQLKRMVELREEMRNTASYAIYGTEARMSLVPSCAIV